MVDHMLAGLKAIQRRDFIYDIQNNPNASEIPAAAIDRKNWEGDAYMLPQLTGTKAHVRYYSAEKGVIYTTDDIIDLTSPNDGYNLKFKQ